MLSSTLLTAFLITKVLQFDIAIFVLFVLLLGIISLITITLYCHDIRKIYISVGNNEVSETTK